MVLRLELKGAAERLEGAAMTTDLGVTQAAKGVFDNAQPGQGAQDVYEEQGDGDEEDDVVQLRSDVVVGEEAERNGEAGADDGDLDFGFVLSTGERQYVKEHHGRAELGGEENLVSQNAPLAGVAELAEPEQQPARDHRRHDEAISQTCDFLRDSPQ